MKIRAGRINKLFGTEGGLMLSLYADFPEEFDPATMPLLVEIDGLEVPLWCARFERRGVAGAVTAFEDLDTERRAAELTGREFWIEQPEEAGDDEEFYLEDLIGFDVEVEEVRTEGAPRRLQGEIVDYYDSDANPLFALELEGREVLVPAAEEFFAHIDFEHGRMKLVLPEGLVDL